MSLFSEEKIEFKLPDAELIYIPGFLTPTQADSYFKLFKSGIKWQQDDIRLFGKTFKQPRLTALYGEKGTSYRYSNILMHPTPFTDELKLLKHTIESVSKDKFTTVLLNYYRDGNDSNAWHADNEKELGINPVIASLSLGAERQFSFKHRKIAGESHKLQLKHGSLLIMKGSMQHHWLHQIPKTKKLVGERINLTFRKIRSL